ncbi:hypothetical protein HPP92_020766 [Vanilla planifolia]|uniref:RHOMBOID-like protein n=1 Tax=Vanilla planifolia TaxID=51239 RepID=A0A835PXN1_VANPL|nr:hypothetical protein HPP92_020766 [Vanilla planifolia]
MGGQETSNVEIAVDSQMQEKSDHSLGPQPPSMIWNVIIARSRNGFHGWCRLSSLPTSVCLRSRFSKDESCLALRLARLLASLSKRCCALHESAWWSREHAFRTLTNWTIYSNKFASLLTLLVVIAINLALGILPHVDNFAHIGGFISGVLLGFLFLIRPQFRWLTQYDASSQHESTSIMPKHKTYQYVLCIISGALLIVGFTGGLIMLFQGVDANQYCSWCHYLSCVPTSLWSCNAEASCMTYQVDSRVNLTCMQNGKTHMYRLKDAREDQISVLCSQLCTL